MGEIRPARRAGQNAPSKVTTMPIKAAVIAAPVLTSSVPTGTPMPRISEMSPDASPSPSPSPSTVPTIAENERLDQNRAHRHAA